MSMFVRLMLSGALLLTACARSTPVSAPDLTLSGPIKVEDRAASGLVGLERKTGKVLWRRGDLPAQVTAFGFPILVLFNGEGFMGLYTVLDVRTGRTLRTLNRDEKVFALEPEGRLYLSRSYADTRGLHITVNGFHALTGKTLYQKTLTAPFKRDCFTIDIPTVDLEATSAVRAREVNRQHFTFEAENRCSGSSAEKAVLTFPR